MQATQCPVAGTNGLNLHFGAQPVSIQIHKCVFGISSVTDNAVDFIPSYQRSIPAHKSCPPEANVPGNAGGWGWRDGSVTFCRKGNWWDKIAVLSTCLNQSSAGATLIQCVEGQCLACFEKCSQQEAMLSSWKCPLPPLPPCMADEESR